MTEPLRDQLAEIAEDAPSADRVMQTVRRSQQRRQQRRRWAAVAAAAAVVVATIGVTTVLRPLGDGPASVPAPVVTSTWTTTSTPGMPVVGTRAGGSSVAVPPGSKLVPFAGATVRSPVSVPASQVSFDTDGPDVVQGPSSYQANWTGQAPTAMETLDVAKGTTGTGQVRGYLVTDTRPALDVYAPGGDVTSTSESITFDGHAAQLLTAPKGSFENQYATPAAARVTWQLPDRRWIQVWAVGEDRGVLIGFAASMTDVPTAFPVAIAPALTIAEYTSATSTDAAFVSQMNGPGITLCKPGAAADPTGEQCLRIWADVDDGSMAQGVVMGEESDAQFHAETTTVVVGNVHVQVNARWQVAWTRWGAATIQVTAPAKAGLTSADLAALAASVRLAPALGVRNEPNPIVESSLAEQSARNAATGTR